MDKQNLFEDLEVLLGQLTVRQVGLFAAACCRQGWSRMTDSRHQAAVVAAERLAAGLLTSAEFETALQPVVELWAALPDHRAGGWGVEHYLTGATRHLGGTWRGARHSASFAARGLACEAGPFGGAERATAERAEEDVQRALLCDIAGPPDGPAAAEAAWRTGDVVGPARGIYEDHAFDRLPILADAPIDAGCDNAGILDHCRSGEPHVRGCWVVDLVLGKARSTAKGARQVDTPVSAEQVQRLRRLTGLPWMECKHFLTSLSPAEREQCLAGGEPRPGGRRRDPIEDDPVVRPLFLAVCEEVAGEVEEWHRGRIAELEQQSPAVADLFRSGRGLCHRAWARIEELLWERHGIHWRSPADMNPGMMID